MLVWVLDEEALEVVVVLKVLVERDVVLNEVELLVVVLDANIVGVVVVLACELDDNVLDAPLRGDVNTFEPTLLCKVNDILPFCPRKREPAPSATEIITTTNADAITLETAFLGTMRGWMIFLKVICAMCNNNAHGPEGIRTHESPD